MAFFFSIYSFHWVIACHTLINPQLILSLHNVNKTTSVWNRNTSSFFFPINRNISSFSYLCTENIMIKLSISSGANHELLFAVTCSRKKALIPNQVNNNDNKSIQRIYNTFEKSPPPSSLSIYLFLFLFLFLHNFTSFSLEKKGIMPGLIAACYELKCRPNACSSLQFLTPSPLNTFRLFIIPFLPFHTRCFHLAGIFGGNF